MEKQEEIPRENDDKDVDILDVVIRNATRPRQITEGDIVESHRGGMYSENNPDGEGDTFTINLPIDIV